MGKLVIPTGPELRPLSFDVRHLIDMKLSLRFSALFGEVVHDGISFTPKSWFDLEQESPARKLLELLAENGRVEIRKVDEPRMHSSYSADDSVDSMLVQLAGDSLIRFESRSVPIPDSILPSLIIWASIEYGESLEMYPEEGVLLRLDAEQGGSSEPLTRPAGR